MIDSSPFGSRRLAELVAADAPIIYGILQPGPVLDDGIPYVRPSEISENGDIRLPEVRRTSPEIAQRYRRATLRSNDLLITIVGTIGRIGVVPPPLDGANITQSSARIRPNADLVCSSYLKWTLRSPPLRRQYDRHRLGTGVPRLNIAHVRDLEIPLPPLPEQRRIADILDKADAIRRKRQEAVKLADEFLRSAFLEMFGDPVMNPKGWPTSLFGEIGTLDRGKSKHRPRNDRALLGGEHPLIQTGEVANSGGVITTYTQTYSDLGLAQSRMWPTGTLYITIAANIAQTGILAFDACFPDSVVGFHPGATVTTEFVQGWLSFLQPLIEARAPQVAQRNINLRILRALDIPVPPVEAQHRFSHLVAAIRATAVRQVRGAETCDDLFDSLVQRAFRGEL